jgi:hypothetical protein
VTTAIVRWVRASAFAVALVAVVAGGLRLCLPALVEALRLLPHLDHEPPDRALGIVLGAVLAALVLGALSWLALAVTVCLAEVLRRPHETARIGESATVALLRPRTMRLLVAAVVGAGGLATPAAIADPHRTSAVSVTQATPDPPPGTRAAVHERDAAVTAQLLAGLPVPDRRTGGVDRQGPTTRPPRAPTALAPPGSSAQVVQVRRGDSLWGMTVSVLTRGADDEPPAAVVDHGWRLLYAANRGVVGPDPDLIRPGTLLEVPQRPPFMQHEPGGLR